MGSSVELWDGEEGGGEGGRGYRGGMGLLANGGRDAIEGFVGRDGTGGGVGFVGVRNPSLPSSPTRGLSDPPMLSLEIMRCSRPGVFLEVSIELVLGLALGPSKLFPMLGVSGGPSERKSIRSLVLCDTPLLAGSERTA